MGSLDGCFRSTVGRADTELGAEDEGKGLRRDSWVAGAGTSCCDEGLGRGSFGPGMWAREFCTSSQRQMAQ